MQKSIKILFIASALVLLAAACNRVQPSSANKNISQSDEHQLATSSNGQTIRQEGLNRITVEQIVESSNLNGNLINAAAGESAFSYLKETHNIQTKSYGTMGEFVTSIDGIKPDSKHFWEFFVNGKSSNLGASSYILKAGDKIEWKLEAISGSNQ